MSYGNALAFPLYLPERPCVGSGNNWLPEINNGLTKRELFAMAAMQGLCANPHVMWDSPRFQGSAKNVALEAVDFADALIDALATPAPDAKGE